MRSILFLSHAPHEAHVGFANAVGAKIKILPFDGYVRAIKKYPILGGYLFALISLLYSLYIRVHEDILLIDGGTSLFVGVFLKKRYKKIKLIYLDADMLFYSLHKNRESKDGRLKFIFNAIDGVISVSPSHKKYVSSFLDVPLQVCAPYPKNVHRTGVERKNYGLYVGRLDPDKNIQRIIEFSLQYPYFEKFIVVGDGALRAYVEKKAKKNSKLAYVGWQKDVEKYYNICKFLIHTPDYDPHPTTTMEAAICGCFPIISRGTGSQYLFEEIFVVNDPKNYNAVKQKIAYIMENDTEAMASLSRSIARFPTKESSLGEFRNAFQTILSQTNYEAKNMRDNLHLQQTG